MEIYLNKKKIFIVLEVNKKKRLSYNLYTYRCFFVSKPMDIIYKQNHHNPKLNTIARFTNHELYI